MIPGTHSEGGSRELSPQQCLLASTHSLWHVHTIPPHHHTDSKTLSSDNTQAMMCTRTVTQMERYSGRGSQGTPQSPWRLAAYSSAGGKGFHSAQQTSVAASRVRSISKLNRAQSLYRVSWGGEVAFQDALGLVQFCGLILEQAQGLVEFCILPLGQAQGLVGFQGLVLGWSQGQGVFSLVLILGLGKGRLFFSLFFFTSLEESD